MIRRNVAIHRNAGETQSLMLDDMEKVPSRDIKKSPAATVMLFVAVTATNNSCNSSRHGWVGNTSVRTHAVCVWPKQQILMILLFPMRLLQRICYNNNSSVPLASHVYCLVIVAHRAPCRSHVNCGVRCVKVVRPLENNEQLRVK